MTTDVELPVDDEERLEELRSENPRRWAFGMMRALDRVDADLVSLAESRSAMIEEYKEARDRFSARREGLRESLLEYVLAEGGPVRLGDTTLNKQLVKMALTIEDPDLFMGELNTEDLDSVTERTLRMGLAKAFAMLTLERTGQILPGVERVEPHNNLTIRGGKS